MQDWFVRYQLQAVEGVSEVASVGGFVKQYQIDLHPDRMRAHRVTLMDVYEAVRKSNIDVGAKVIENSGIEFFIRGVGFVKTVEDLEKVVIREEGGTPVLLRSVATVQLGPDFRRGSLDKAGVEAVGGVVLMRYGENPLEVLARVKAKLEQIAPGLPSKKLADGRESKLAVVPFYDRTTIVGEAIDTLKEASSELKRLMHEPANSDMTRPLLELDQLRWQRVRDKAGSEYSRLLWRRQDPRDRNAEVAAGLVVLRESRILPGLGREFMPPLDEGSFLYMPSLLPQGSLAQAVEVSSKQDLAIAGVPEVESVVGKIGRAESALDPAPIGMMESIVVLKPESQWRTRKVERVFRNWPGFLKAPLAWVWPEERRITKSEILAELQERSAIPGVLPTWLQPIQTRLVMLQTGFRAMMGVKIFGSDLREIAHRVADRTTASRSSRCY